MATNDSNSESPTKNIRPSFFTWQCFTFPSAWKEMEKPSPVWEGRIKKAPSLRTARNIASAVFRVASAWNHFSRTCVGAGSMGERS